MALTEASDTRDDGVLQGRERADSFSVRKLRTHIVASVNIKPLEDKILVQAVEAETTTASGLVIPETAKEKPQEARVVAVGPGRVDEKGNRIPVDIKEGDVVVFSRYGGTEVKYQGEEYLILSARDVLAIVD